MFSTFMACVGKAKDLSVDKRALLIIKKINGWRWFFDCHCKNVIKNHNTIETHRFNIDSVDILCSCIYYNTDIQASNLYSVRVGLFEDVAFFSKSLIVEYDNFFQQPEKCQFTKQYMKTVVA